MRYAREGRVFNLQWDPHQQILEASVWGNARSPYHVQIHFKPKSRDMPACFCTCPVAVFCKHAVAVLVEFRKSNSPNEPQSTMMNAQTRDWLERVKTLSEPTKKSVNCLLYLLDVDRIPAYSRLVVRTVKVRQLQKGGYGTPKPFRSTTPTHDMMHKSEDVECFVLLAAARHALSDIRGEYALSGPLAAQAVGQLLKTGRCHWRSSDTPPLTQGGRTKGEFDWEYDDTGRQQIRCKLSHQTKVMISRQPLLYYNQQRNQIGFIKTDLSPAVENILLTAPRITPDEVPAMEAALREVASDGSMPLPCPLTIVHKQQTPTPCLHLSCEQFYHKDYDIESRREIRRKDEIIHAVVSFRYEDHRVKYDALIDSFRHLEHDTLVEVTRDHAEETRQVKRLIKLFDEAVQATEGMLFKPIFEGDTLMLEDDAIELRNIGPQLLQLKQSGWEITFEEDYPYHHDLVEVEEWYTKLEDSSDIQWFECELGVVIAGKRVNLLPHLIKAIDKGVLKRLQTGQKTLQDEAPVMLHLGKHQALPIPPERLQTMLNLVMALYTKDSAEKRRLKLTNYHAALLAEMERAFVSVKLRWMGSKRLLALGERLGDFTKLRSTRVPKLFKGTLRPYQKAGVDWLAFLSQYGLGGILADDMGLGKTVQALAHLTIVKAKAKDPKPSLIVAPTSVVSNWSNEATRFTPHFKVMILRGLDRHKALKRLNSYDLLLTTYPLLLRDRDALLDCVYDYVILDESQYIKNPQTKVTQIVIQLNADHRLCLTGTPMENHLGELWSQFHFLMPGLLGGKQEFRNRYRNPIEHNSDEACRDQLMQLIRPFILRRTKEAVVQELPDKTEIIERIDMSSAQRDLYETIRVAMDHHVRKAIDEKGIERSQLIILEALLKLRQVCCDPRLLKSKVNATASSAKLQRLMELLEELLSEGKRVLLFSQFTSMLSLIEEEFKKRSLTWLKLTGNTRDRRTPVERFQRGEVPIFLISLKAGGTGLNLTAADTVIHYDPWWNPAVECQATDRAHRIGQKKAVFVYKLVTQGTIEEKILEMQARKRALVEGLLGGDKLSGKLTRSDFEHLLGNS